MGFGKRHDTTDTADFCPRQLVTDFIPGNDPGARPSSAQPMDGGTSTIHLACSGKLQRLNRVSALTPLVGRQEGHLDLGSVRMN